MQVFEILEQLMVPNRDNGSTFTDTRRIDRIKKLLWDSPYRCVNSAGLFFLFAAKPLEDLEAPVLISSHIDCVESITRFFAEDAGEDLLLGTFDNGITNAAVTALMLEGSLPENVVIAFTGDEEDDSQGAQQVVRYLEGLQKTPVATIVLDVTDMGWEQAAPFTVENNFFSPELGKKVVACAEAQSDLWKFVPSDPEEIPSCVAQERLIPVEAECDESWEYDEYDWQCFSFCLPVKGNMHGNSGVYARKTALVRYTKALSALANALATLHP